MNQEIYEKNIDALRKRFPILVKLVEETSCEEDLIDIKVETAQDGTTILRYEKDGRRLYTNGKRKPQEVVVRILEQWGKLNRVAPILIVGIGNVALLKYVLEQTSKENNIIIYEPSVTTFLKVMEQTDMTFLFENRAVGLLIEGVNDEEMGAVINAFVNISNLGFLKTYVSPVYREFYGEKVLTFLKEFDRITTQWIVNRNTKLLFSTVEADNLFHNVSYLCDGYITTQLCDVIPRDIPAIVVAAGPSLNHNIMELKKAKNKAFIIAVDTAMRPLVKAGIMPDLYVTVDGKKPLSLVDFEAARQIPLVASITSAKGLLQQHYGKKFFFFEGEMIPYNILAMNGIVFSSVSCGGSVACSAFSLAYKMGFPTIIMVGQDLAHTGNKTHADGTFKEKMDTIDTSHAIMVEGNNGEMIPTEANLKVYLDWFNYYIAGCEDVRVINATEGGAKIQNTEIMTLADAIAQECHKEVDIAACFEQLTPVLNEEQRKRAVDYLNSIPEMFQTLKKEVVRERKNYQKLKKICSQNTIDTAAYLKVLNQIKKVTKKIEDHELYSLIVNTLVAAEYAIRSEQYYEEDTMQAEGLEIARKGIGYMKLVEECIDLLIPLTEETVGKLQ